VLHTLLAGQALNRLYLTQVGRLLGGQSFASILEGELLATAVDAQLSTVYHDAEALDGLGQLLLAYDIVATK